MHFKSNLIGPIQKLRAIVTIIYVSFYSVHGLNNGLGLSPPLGYSSWNDCASQVTEERIKNVTRHFIETGLAAKGYVHINVDAGWLLARNNITGELIEDRKKFPSGMKALGDWIHEQVVPGHGKIMKYGLYTSRGTCQCGTALYKGPGGNGYEKIDSKWFANAGADYLKVDSCCGSQDHDIAFSDYGKWRDGLNESGRHVYLSLCGWYTWYAPQGANLGNSWRIAGDGTNWGALSNCINSNVDLHQYAAPGAWNDPDLLQGTGIGSNDFPQNPHGCYRKEDIPQAKNWYQSEKQGRAQFSMWAVMSAPLIISADVCSGLPFTHNAFHFISLLLLRNSDQFYFQHRFYRLVRCLSLVWRHGAMRKLLLSTRNLGTVDPTKELD